MRIYILAAQFPGPKKMVRFIDKMPMRGDGRRSPRRYTLNCLREHGCCLLRAARHCLSFQFSCGPARRDSTTRGWLQMSLQQCTLSWQAFTTCASHAMSTEKQEVRERAIGRVRRNLLVSAARGSGCSAVDITQRPVTCGSP